MSELKYQIIDSLEQYNEYVNIHESLVSKEDDKFEKEISLLELLISEFDKGFRNKRRKNPVELLKYILTEDRISVRELSKKIKEDERDILAVLNYERKISATLARKLAKTFSMKQVAFYRSYRLKTSTLGTRILG